MQAVLPGGRLGKEREREGGSRRRKRGKAAMWCWCLLNFPSVSWEMDPSAALSGLLMTPRSLENSSRVASYTPPGGWPTARD